MTLTLIPALALAESSSADTDLSKLSFTGTPTSTAALAAQVPAQRAPEEMLELLATLRASGYLVGIVGAGDFEKQQGQLGGPDLRERRSMVKVTWLTAADAGTYHCRSPAAWVPKRACLGALVLAQVADFTTFDHPGVSTTASARTECTYATQGSNPRRADPANRPGP